MIEWVSTHIPPWVFITIIMHLVVLGTVAYLILLERKVASWVQDRIGPNRVGPWGLLQPIADGLKFMLKEDYRPAGVDKVLFTIAPIIMMIVIIISIAVIPWGGMKGQIIRNVKIPAGAVPADVVMPLVPFGHELVAVSIPSDPPRKVLFREAGAEAASGEFFKPVEQEIVVDVAHGWHVQVANINIGALFALAALSLAVYGIVIGGWASNNKYSFLGGLRATVNMISYEIPLGLSLIAIVLMFGTLDLGVIVERQTHYWMGVIPAWNVFAQPLAFVLFLICIHAEANRAPFDLAEAEQELVGGYHTEYSSMRFALFFLGEYAGMITTSAICVALFFGGWHLPWLDKFGPLATEPGAGRVGLTTHLWICVLRAAVFYVKTLGVIFIFMWVRWSLPRFRFDQLMDIAWRALIPLSLALVLGTSIVVYARDGRTLYGADTRTAALLLAMNVALVAAAMAAGRLLPAQANTNRRISVRGSRFSTPPVSPSLN
jgi:NADH-quinone oxidoreductase subunit H